MVAAVEVEIHLSAVEMPHMAVAVEDVDTEDTHRIQPVIGILREETAEHMVVAEVAEAITTVEIIRQEQEDQVAMVELMVVTEALRERVEVRV